MKHNERQVLDWLAITEGGYVNHPADPGGATNKGVIQRVYDAWRRNNGWPVQSVKFITTDEAETIYREQYFAPVWFNRLPDGLDYAVADYAVNSGVSRAVKDLQRVLRDLGHSDVAVDGVMGNMTYQAILRENDPAEIVRRLCARRMALLRSLRHWPTFGRGWTRRVEGDEPGAQDRDTGVLDRALRMAKGQEQVGRVRAHERAKAPEEQVSILRVIFEAIRRAFHG